MKVKAIILPSNKKGWNKGDIVKAIHGYKEQNFKSGDIVLANVNETHSAYWQAQELYLVDESSPIVEGDWLYDFDSKLIMEGFEDNGCFEFGKNSKKVIASTDKSLEGLPGIPQDLIQHYIDMQGKVDNVEIASELINGKDVIQLLPNANTVVWIPEEKVPETAEEYAKAFGKFVDEKKSKQSTKSIAEIAAEKEYPICRFRFLMKKDVEAKDINLEQRNSFIEGWNSNPNQFSEKDMLEALNKFGEYVAIKCTGQNLQMIGELMTWFPEYLKNNQNK